MFRSVPAFVHLRHIDIYHQLDVAHAGSVYMRTSNDAGADCNRNYGSTVQGQPRQYLHIILVSFSKK